jgi:hypothetical protein
MKLACSGVSWPIAARLISRRWISALLIFFGVVIGSSTASACTFPLVPDGYGNCVALCPAGQTALPGTGTCVGAGVTCAANQSSTPPSGTIYTSCCPSGQQPAILNTSGGPVFTGSCCPPGQAAQGDGSCLPELTAICQAGQNPNISLCCLPNQAMTNRLTCCPVGQEANPNGSCGPDPCSGTGLAPTVNNSCKSVCPVGQHVIPGTTTCLCPNGYPPKDGRCNLNPCGPHQHLNAQGLCETVCPPGYPLAADNTCKDPCAPGLVWLSNQNRCVCAPGPSTTGLTCCPAYQAVYTDGYCSPKMKHNAAAVACEHGLVPREAYQGDPVCVILQSHDQTIADNLAAPSHTNPEGLCYHGYFWRRAIRSDHVCVTPEARARVQAENAQQQQQLSNPVQVVQTPPGGTGEATGGYSPTPQPSPCPTGTTLANVQSAQTIPNGGISFGPVEAECVMTPPCPYGTSATNGTALTPIPGPGGSAAFACCLPGTFQINGGQPSTAYCCPDAFSTLTSAGPNGGLACYSYPTNQTAPVTVAPIATCPAGFSGIWSYLPVPGLPAGPQPQSPPLSNATPVCYVAPSCPANYAFTNNQCVPSSNQTTTLPYVPLPPNLRMCPRGTIKVSDGSCCTPAQATSLGTCCPANTTPQVNGQCCPNGQTAQRNGKCGYNPPVENSGVTAVPKGTPPSNNTTQCGAGLMLRDGRCLPAIQTSHCGSGEIMRDGRCATQPPLNRNIYRWRWLHRRTTGRTFRRMPEIHRPPEHQTPGSHGGGFNRGGHGASHGGGRRR